MSEKNFLLYDVFREIFLLRVAPSKTTETNRELDLFGVFVTIYRFPDAVQGVFNISFSCNLQPQLFDASLHSDRMQVNGCIGYMHPTMQRVAPKDIYERAKSVGVSAARDDDRRRLFSTAIEHDPFSLLHISYLRRPVTRMDPQEKNDDWGIICQSTKGLTTFLPKVFVGDTLGEITNDISEKAATSCAAFYQYKVYDFESSFYSLMIDTIQKQVYLFAAQIDQYFYDKDFIFYERFPDGSTRIDKSEIIRNLACLECISKLPVLPDTAAAVKRNVDAIQTLAFLRKNLSSHEKFSLSKKYNNALCRKNFYGNLADTEFELGQYGIYYTKFCSRNDLEIYTVLSMLDKLQQAELQQSSIFRLNWYCQLLWTALQARIHKQGNSRESVKVNVGVSAKLSAHTKFIAERLLFYINQPGFDSSYTNVLAVSFEAICFLIDACKTLDMHRLCQKVISAMFYVFILLEQRCSFYTMFPFENGTCRLDISCHVYNGMLVVLSRAGK